MTMPDFLILAVMLAVCVIGGRWAMVEAKRHEEEREKRRANMTPQQRAEDQWEEFQRNAW